MPSDIIIEWEGVGGDRFRLHGPGRAREGVWAERFTGLLDAPRQVRHRSAARQDGATLGSVKTDPREITIEVHLIPVGHRDLGQIETTWWNSWSYHEDGKLIVRSDSGTRWIHLRLAHQPDHDLDRDPHTRAVASATITAIAGDPFWQAGTSTTTFDRPQDVTVDNPTDLPAWPRFTVDRGTWAFPDGITGRTVSLAPSGRPMLVDTNPLVEPVVYDDGSPAFQLLRGRGFTTPIPPRTQPTPAPVTGTGPVRVSIDRRWQRAW